MGEVPQAVQTGNSKLSSEILKTKRHFDILDGLRGIAALSVVTFHFMEMAISNYSKNFIGHGFLAVDFFFCLSGFVIGYAYDDRIGKIGIVEFLKSRLIRLHPMVVLGSVLGLFAFLFDPFSGIQHAYSIGKVALIFLASIFLIPFPAMTERTFNLFSFNAPAWSLFWEYVANIFYAVMLYKFSRRSLLLFTTLAAAVLCAVGYHSGSLGGGMMPYFKWNVLAEALVILFYFPLLVALGAGAALTKRSEPLCVFSGKISYPLYTTHYAVIWMFMNYYNTHKPGTQQLARIVTTGVILLTGVAYVAMVAYDIPVRRYLTSKRRVIASTSRLGQSSSQ